MNIELAITELIELQKNDLKAFPVSVASYATQYIKEKSKAVQNLSPCEVGGFIVSPGSVVPNSPTRIRHIEILEEAPILRICARPGFIIAAGLPEARIMNVFNSMVISIDRLFDTCVMHVLGIQNGSYVVDPSQEHYGTVRGYIFVSDVINEAYPDVTQEAQRRFIPPGLTDEWFEFHLTMSLSMAVIKKDKS